MKVPNLNRIVDTYVPVSSNDFPAYLEQLRRDVLPYICRLQSDGRLRWFSFLLHEARHLDGREPEDGRLFLHLRLERATDLGVQDFFDLLPKHFLKPNEKTFKEIEGLDGSVYRDDNPANGWKIHGAASEWVICLLEGYEEGPLLEHVLQFMHFITNPLMMGHKCQLVPTGCLF